MRSGRTSWLFFLLAAWLPGQQREYLRVRFTSAAGGVLETPIVHCRNAAGVAVDLVGAIHVADRAYYQALNRRFRSYDAVLFEMVKPAGVPPTVRRGNLLSALQRLIRSALGLTFQLDEIDYGAPNMVHADMDVREFAQRFREELPRLLRRVQASVGKNGWEGATTLGDWLRALLRRDRARRLKFLVGKELQAHRDLLVLTTWLEDSVLIQGRNRVVVAKLREQLRRGRRRLAVFYGVGHLPDLERRLRSELGFTRTGVTWLVAWDFREPLKSRRL